jgi:hypothetical protein
VGLINQAPTNKSNCLAKKSVGLINQAPTNKSNCLAKKSVGLMNQFPQINQIAWLKKVRV